MNKVGVIQKDLTLALRIVDDIGFYFGNEEHQEADLVPVVQRAGKLKEELKAKFDTDKILLDADTCACVEKLIRNLEMAVSSFILHVVAETDNSFIPAKTPEGRKKAEELVQKTIPHLKDEFEQIARTIVSV